MHNEKPMQLGMIGSRGATRPPAHAGRPRCVVYDPQHADHVKQLEGEGATGATSLEDFVAKLEKPRAAG